MTSQLSLRWLPRTLLVASALLASIASAQWSSQPLPAKSRLLAVVESRDSPSGYVLFAQGQPDGAAYVLYASGDDGATWTPRPIAGFDGRFIPWAGTRPTPAGLPSRTGDLFITVRAPGGSGLIDPYDILKSGDLGLTWSVVARNTGAAAVAFDPTMPTRWFGIGTGEVAAVVPLVFRSDDDGETWRPLDTRLHAQVSKLRVGPDGTVYALNFPVLVSRDHGETWTASSVPTADGPATLVFDLLAFAHPTLGIQHAIAATSSGLYATDDGTVTWHAVGYEGFVMYSLGALAIPEQAEPVVVAGYRYGLSAIDAPGLQSLARGITGINDTYQPVGGPYAAGDGAVWKCASFASCMGGVAPQRASLVEFHNLLLDHYFMTANAVEAAGIDAGAAGPGWVRTGFVYPAYATTSGTHPDMQSVCRFYGTPGIGPNSHFHTLDAAECVAARSDPGWMLESPVAFVFAAPIGRLTFPSGTVTYSCGARRPVYRLYNNRFAQNDSNHRYTTDTDVYQVMQTLLGWIGEGIRMCVD